MTPTLAALGELRADHLELLEGETPIQILCAAPGWLPVSFRGAAELARVPHGRVPTEAAFAWRKAMLDFFAAGVDSAPQDPDWEARIGSWVASLDSGSAKVFQLAGRSDHTRFVSLPRSTRVFFGSLTGATATFDAGLQLELTGSEHDGARAWFERQLPAADDISREVAEILRSSWAGRPLDPEDLYYKILFDYFGATLSALDREVDDNPLLDVLTEFQEEAYQYAKGVLRRYGGVFLSDVVGLGKTFIALALLKHLQDRYGRHAVVVAPPAVCGTWEELAREHRVEMATVSLGKLEDLAVHEDREILVVDESHHFRNVGTRRHDLMSRWLRPGGEPSVRQVILLSATPQNNDPTDVLHQIQLFPDNYNRLPYRGDTLEGWFRSVTQSRADLRDLLQHVLVRRTRSFVRENYPGATIRRRGPDGSEEEIPVKFPTRVSGPEQCLRYELDAGVDGPILYDQILDSLGRMTYPLHSLGRFVRPECAHLPEVVGLGRTGASLRGLYKCLLLKRLESSLHAFGLSVARLTRRLEAAEAELARGLVTVYGAPTDGPDEDPDPDTVQVKAALFDGEALGEAIAGDAAVLRDLRGRVSRLDSRPDAKLRRLERWLGGRAPGAHKTLVFTQFADTANWLGEKLGQRFGRTRAVTGSTGGKLAIAKRFAPIANRAPTEDEIDLLISTDALSEGVNLQDGDTLVNYDLHWNPVRLIQRAGRIDRIGSEKDEIWVASFLPERRLEEGLRLEEVLRRRIDEFLRVFGEDSRILPAEELPEPAVVASAFTGEALRLADGTDDMDGLSRHVNRILALRRQDPERFGRIAAIRPGHRAWSQSPRPHVVACRLGWYWNFWAAKADAEIELVPDLEGLDRLWEHAVAGTARPGAASLPGTLARLARSEFGPRAAEFRQLRVHPARTKGEDFALERLDRHREEAPPSQQPLLDAIDRWVRGGTASAVIQREARAWKRQNLSPSAVFHDLRSLYRRFPPQEEELGEEELVGIALGSGGASSSGRAGGSETPGS